MSSKPDHLSAFQLVDLHERAYLELLDHQLPVVCWTTDHELRFTSARGSGLVHLGLEEGGSVGLTLEQYFQTDDRDFLPIAMHHRVLGGESVSYELEWSGNTYQSFIRPLRDGKGRICGCAGIAIDITDRKRAEKERDQLQRLREQQAAIVELATHELVVTGRMSPALQQITETSSRVMGADRVGIWLIRGNGAELHCVNLFERTTGKHSSGTVLHVREYPEYFKALEIGRNLDAVDARTDPRTREFRDAYLGPLGIVSMLDSPIRLEGKVVGVVCHEYTGSPRSWHPDEILFSGEIADQVANTLLNHQKAEALEALQASEARLAQHRDHLEELVELRTADLERTHEKLRSSERLASIGTLAAGVAHEINNPLGLIELEVHLAAARTEDPEMRRSLADIRGSVERCARIVKSILRFAREEATEKWPLDLNDVVLRARDLTRVYAERHNVGVGFDLASELPRVHANATELEQVLVNLIHNAVNASQDRGAVRIRTRAGEESIQLSVEDEGRGMTPEQRDRAFDPFYTTRPEQGGTGLGLSTCHGIVTQHGGTIQIASEVEQGTTVTIELPALPVRDPREGPSG